jgi:hypothetical protein
LIATLYMTYCAPHRKRIFSRKALPWSESPILL